MLFSFAEGKKVTSVYIYLNVKFIYGAKRVGVGFQRPTRKWSRLVFISSSTLSPSDLL